MEHPPPPYVAATGQLNADDTYSRNVGAPAELEVHPSSIAVPANQAGDDSKAIASAVPTTQHQEYASAAPSGHPAQAAAPQNAQEPLITPLNQVNLNPAFVECPACGYHGWTRTTNHIGNSNHAWAGVVCIVTLWLGWVMYLVNSLKDVTHSCGKCGALLATFHRSNRVEVHYGPLATHPVTHPYKSVKELHDEEKQAEKDHKKALKQEEKLHKKEEKLRQQGKPIVPQSSKKPCPFGRRHPRGC